jgi:MGT family glycosyltransferase
MSTEARRFLFVMFEGGGNVPPQLGVARRLVERGHAVRVLGDRAIEADVRAARCEFAPYRLAPHHNMRSQQDCAVRQWEAKSRRGQLQRICDAVFFGPAAEYARDVLEEVARFRPDAIGVDSLLWGAMAGAERSRVPSAVMMHHVCHLRLDGLPPPALGLAQARGPLGRLRDRLLYRLMPPEFARGLATLNGAREAIGLSPLASLFEQPHRLARVLVLTSREFDYRPRSAPPEVRWVGAQLDDPPWADPWISPWPADHPDPLVVVALGSTYQDQRALTARVIEALGGLPVRGLVTLGGVFAPSEFVAPANVVIVRSVPHRAVFPSARAVVAHGGHGTVIKALAHGVPVLCIPLGRDQGDNAARLSHTGAGVALKPTSSATAIRRALRLLLDEPSFAAAAHRLADAIAADVSADAAVAELESLADAGASQPGRSPSSAAV